MYCLPLTTTHLDLEPAQTFSDLLPGLIGLTRRLHPLWKEAPGDELADWFQWYFDHWLLGKSMDKGGSCHAVVAVRLLERWEDFVDEWTYEPSGEICFVDLALADNRSALREAVEELRRRHGEPALVMWERQKKPEHGSPRIYTWKMFNRMMRNLYGWSTETS